MNEYKSGVDGVVGVFDDPGEALGALLQDELTVLLVTGSLYLVSDVIRYFKYKK